MNFLDLKINLDSNNVLSATIYSKPTYSHLYLHGTSCHYKKSIDGNSIDVATRLRRICSSDDEFNKQADMYKAYLAGRGHKTNVINKAFKKLTNSTREAIRSKKGNRVKNATSPVIFTTQYNPLVLILLVLPNM